MTTMFPAWKHWCGSIIRTTNAGTPSRCHSDQGGCGRSRGPWAPGLSTITPTGAGSVQVAFELAPTHHEATSDQLTLVSRGAFHMLRCLHCGYVKALVRGAEADEAWHKRLRLLTIHPRPRARRTSLTSRRTIA